MFKMLNIGDVAWVSATMGLGPLYRDLHFDQRMLAPYIVAFKWKAYLALTTSETGYVLQPVLVTPEGELRHAYNFGGPMASSDLVNAKEHVDGLNEWAGKEGLKSQYCTLVPFLHEKQLQFLKNTDILPQYKKESVIVDLTDQKVRGTTRRLANKAKSSGVNVRSHPLTSLNDFLKIYEATMERNDAKEHWRLPPSWFEAFFRFVKPTLLIASITEDKELKTREDFDGVPESACLIAYSQQYPTAYYHFAGSFNTQPRLGANHLMVMAACEYVKSLGIRYLFLGGGRTNSDDDALLLFKSGFSTKKLPVYTYQMMYT